MLFINRAHFVYIKLYIHQMNVTSVINMNTVDEKHIKLSNDTFNSLTNRDHVTSPQNEYNFV